MTAKNTDYDPLDGYKIPYAYEHGRSSTEYENNYLGMKTHYCSWCGNYWYTAAHTQMRHRLERRMKDNGYDLRRAAEYNGVCLVSIQRYWRPNRSLHAAFI